jgi:hypothetical protein
MNKVLAPELEVLAEHTRRQAKILIPLMPGSDNQALIKLGQWFARETPVLFVGIVPMQEGENLSTGTKAAQEFR